MFGVVPKSIWNKTNPADERNLCSWAMRCLLIEDGDRLILIDNGLGDKQGHDFFRHYYLHGDGSLTKSIQQAGYGLNDVTDVFLTHLHFDHCGGGVRKDGDKLELVFPSANYWSNEAHWKWATEPNARERASFLKENIIPMKENGHLKMVDKNLPSPFPQFDILHVNGHTESMMVPLIKYKGKTICFVADLIPSSSHIPVPYVMGYDTRPLITMTEKEKFLKEAADNGYILFFEHDPVHECGTVAHTERGIRLKETFPLSSIG